MLRWAKLNRKIDETLRTDREIDISIFDVWLHIRQWFTTAFHRVPISAYQLNRVTRISSFRHVSKLKKYARDVPSTC